MGKIFIVIAIALGVAIVWRWGDASIGGDMRFGDALQIMLVGAFLLSLVASALAHHRGRVSSMALAAVAWLAIFGAVVVGYSYRTELSGVAERVLDEVSPGRAVRAPPGEAIAVRGRNGHFHLDAVANGVKVNMVFDTGASSVTLRAEDARRMGFAVDKLDFSIPVSTANGRTMAAPVSIDALSVGSITLRNVRALVGKPGALQDNLLGMSFLDRLAGYNVEKNRLTMRQ